MSEPVYYASLGGVAALIGVVFLLSRRTLGNALVAEVADVADVQKGHV